MIQNKQKKNLLLLALLATFLLLSSCSSSNGQTAGWFGGGSTSTTSSGSTNGVTLEFVDGNPPSEMFKSNRYNFAFVFKNYQKHAISDLQMKLEGYETSYVSGLNTEYSISNIPKATDTAGPGVNSELVAEGVALDGFEGDYNFNPEFKYCYTATTTYREQICVPSTKNQCTITVEANKEQNGPLTLTIDAINNLEDSVRLDFTITNSGSGKVVNECFNTDNYANEYSLGSVKLGGNEGNCEAVSGFQIANNKASFYCTFPRTSGDESYASQISVEFSYKYQQSLKKSIPVRDLTQNIK